MNIQIQIRSKMKDSKSKRSQLTIKRGILAIVVMYACQLLAGVITSYAFKFFVQSDDVSIEMVGLSIDEQFELIQQRAMADTARVAEESGEEE